MLSPATIRCCLVGALLVGGCAGTDYSDGLNAQPTSVTALAAARAETGCPDPALNDVPQRSSRAEGGTVIVTGAVARPGAVALGEHLRTLGAVLAAAGSAENEPPSSAIRLIRGGKLYDFDYVAEGCTVRPGDIAMLDGDLVRVPRADETYVTVIGEVGQQGRVKVPPGGMTVLEAVASVRGTNNITAQRDVVYLVRRNGQGAPALKLSASDMLNNLATPVPVRHNDVIVLPPSGLAQWDRFWRQLLSFLGPAVDRAAGVP